MRNSSDLFYEEASRLKDLYDNGELTREVVECVFRTAIRPVQTHVLHYMTYPCPYGLELLVSLTDTLVKNVDPNVLVLALGTYGPVAEEAVIKVLWCGDQDAKLSAAEILGVIGSPASIPPLLENVDLLVAEFAKENALRSIEMIRERERTGAAPQRYEHKFLTPESVFVRGRALRAQRKASEDSLPPCGI